MLTRPTRILTQPIAALLFIGASGTAAAQPAAATWPTPPYAGDCTVVTQISGLTPGTDVVELQLDRARLARQTAGNPNERIVVQLKGPLADGDELRVLLTRGNRATVIGTVAVTSLANVAPACGDAEADFDDREAFGVTGYLGNAFDNFAPNEVGNYIQSSENLSTTDIKSRYIAGVDAEYRFWRMKRHPDVQFWLSTETLYGLRTADVDCRTSPTLPVCQTSFDPTKKPEQFLFILNHASSLEAFISPRLEFFTFHADTPAKLYVTARLGFLAVENAAHVYRNDHIGLGVLAPVGPFAGSFAEIGWGRSAMFHEANGDKPGWDRMKIDATVLFDIVPGWRERLNPFKRMASATRGFIEIYIDQAPGGSAPDSVQTFVGVQFDFRDAFGK
jgi:hypothetical protein